jgi:glycosyltransferase involved in cell wall biosynthesis
MKVLHVSTYDFGGAGKAALRLHRNLAAREVDSRLLVLYRRSTTPDVCQIGRRGLLYRARNAWVKAHLKLRTDPDYYFQQQLHAPVRDAAGLLRAAGFQPDVIVAHWVSNFVSAQGLCRLQRATGAPLVWYLMDMAPMTGGCHYAWNCRGYRRRCGECPALYSKDAGDLSHRTWRVKQEALRRSDLVVVAGSSRQEEQAGKASLFAGRPVQRILVGLDAAVFHPGDRAAARARFQLPPDRKIVFFSGQGPEQRRKGMGVLADALRRLSDREPELVSRMLLATTSDLSRLDPVFGTLFPCRNLGYLDDAGLAAAYRAADVFVSPSVEDSGPMMINEAVLCGTPVAAFAMGVALDLVHTGETGYRAVLGEAADLAEGIRVLVAQPPEAAARMAERCAETGRRRCAADVQARAFEELFSRLTATRQWKGRRNGRRH